MSRDPSDQWHVYRACIRTLYDFLSLHASHNREIASNIFERDILPSFLPRSSFRRFSTIFYSWDRVPHDRSRSPTNPIERLTKNQVVQPDQISLTSRRSFTQEEQKKRERILSLYSILYSVFTVWRRTNFSLTTLNIHGQPSVISIVESRWKWYRDLSLRCWPIDSRPHELNRVSRDRIAQ